MIIIKSNHTANTPPLFASGLYYSKNDFQYPITAIKQSITKPTVLKNNLGITLLYFANGNGSILVNSRTYNIKKGMLMCLGSYHYFQFQPSSEPIEVIKCQLSYDTFVYMAANPYFKFSKINLYVHPLTSLLKDYDLKRVELIMDELIEVTNKISHKEKNILSKDDVYSNTTSTNLRYKIGQKEFLLCMKLIGILHKTHTVNFENILPNDIRT